VAEVPLVSAVIPTFDNAGMVVEAVQSVLDQTWPRVEIVVVDDGSTDDTLVRLGAFGDRIRIVRQEHQGPAVARNAGIRASAGEYVGFLDSDDLWMPKKVEKSMDALRATPKAGVAYTAVRIRETDTGRTYLLPQYTTSGWMARDLFLECKGVNTSTLVVKRECLDAVDGFDEEFFRAQDWDLMVRLAEKFPYVHVPEALTERRLHERSLSVTHRDLYATYNLLVIRKALARDPELYEALKDDALARAHYRFGMLHYGDFRLKEARAEFRRSLSHRWHIGVLGYFLRTFLPVELIRRLRGFRMRAAGPKKPPGDSAHV